jgi:uncharacterized protein YciI
MASDNRHIFVCISQYKKPLAEVDLHLPAHIDWLKKQDSLGRTVVTGRQVPGTGGICIMAAQSRDEMLEIMATDPFQVHGCASYWIFELEPNPVPDRGRLMDYFFGAAFAAGNGIKA